jgi:hypothetical protein
VGWLLQPSLELWDLFQPNCTVTVRLPVSDHSFVVEWFMSLRRNMATTTMPKSRPRRIASIGNPGTAGAVDGATANVVEAESPVDPIAVIV